VRVLLTGHQGYLGTVMAPILAAAGLLVIAYATLRPGGPRFRPAPGWTCLICGATGGVDIALLNAGIEGAHTPLEEYPPEVFARVLAVNVSGVWLGLRAAIQPLRRRGGGSVVITSSIQGSSALPYTSAYTTSKHAVIGMMKGAALELAKDNIRVNCIVPGMTDTPMMDRIHESSGAPAQMAATVRATIPMRRYARPEEIARLMLFLASQESSYCTGSTYAADGGILASWTSPSD